MGHFSKTNDADQSSRLPGNRQEAPVLWNTLKQLAHCILGLGGRILPDPNQSDEAIKKQQ